MANEVVIYGLKDGAGQFPWGAVMHITKIIIKNFRLLKDTSLDVRKDISLLIGKNNTGKTSLIAAFEKFFHGKRFDINDFPLCQRNTILSITDKTPESDITMQMILEIKYGPDDKLGELADFILDLDETIDTVRILLECRIDKLGLLKDLTDKKDIPRYITKNLGDYTDCKLFVFKDYQDLDWQDRSNLVEKDHKLLRNVINLQVIHAKRNVSSSEESTKDRDALSALTNKYFNESSKATGQDFSEINQKMIEMDDQLNLEYAKIFEPFLKSAKDFLDIKNLKVISNVQSNELVSNQSQVVYGDDHHMLPEHLNGLGFMNILYLLLNIEIKKQYIQKDNKAINLLFIEEPEAHTHPQMQYVFAKQIRNIVQGINNLQTLITTHSAHIVSQCDFQDIRYLSLVDDINVIIKNFYDQLRSEYTDANQFKFLVQYLTLQSSELFFADKIIFIEGTTENILLPYFMNEFDTKHITKGITPLASQHISIMEVGANAKAFAPFLNFLGIKTLIITDIDGTKKVVEDDNGKKTITYQRCPISESEYTSNYTIKHYYNAPEIGHKDFPGWYAKLKCNEIDGTSNLIKVAYQIEEAGYHARSFEDAFLHANRMMIKSIAKDIDGLKLRKHYEDDAMSPYDLIDKTLESKSLFASSLLYRALTDDKIDWIMPLYIKEALTWLAE